MSRLPGYAPLAAAVLVLAGATTAVALAAGRDEVAPPASVQQQSPRTQAPAYGSTVSPSGEYAESESGHDQRRRGRGHGSSGSGSGGHGSDDGGSHD